MTYGNVAMAPVNNGVGRLGAQRVGVRRRAFDPTAPLAGLGYEAAASATDASIDVQQDMGSWLSRVPALAPRTAPAAKPYQFAPGASAAFMAPYNAINAANRKPAVRNDWFVQSIRRAHGKPGMGMGSWLSKALKGDVGKIAGGILDAVVPGAGAVVGIIGGNKSAPVVQPGTNAPVSSGPSFNQFAPGGPPAQIVYVPDDETKKLPTWVIPSAIGAGVLLVALVALKK